MTEATRNATQDIEKQTNNNILYNTQDGLYKGDCLEANNEQILYKSISNCIIKKSQNIRIENVKIPYHMGPISSDIVQAGCFVYVPNGPGNFDKVIIPVDKGQFGSAAEHWFAYNTVTEKIVYCNITSGTTPPSGSGTFYNTETNTIYNYTNGVCENELISLPIRIMYPTYTYCNGLGYAGDVLFVIPGLRCFLADGRETDGSLKSVIYTTDRVITVTDTNGLNGVYKIILTQKGILLCSDYSYDYNDNIITADGVKVVGCYIGDIEYSSGTIVQGSLKFNEETSLIASNLTPDLDTGVSMSSSGFTSEATQWLSIAATSINNKSVSVYLNGNHGIYYLLNKDASNSISTNSWFLLKRGDVITTQIGTGCSLTMYTYKIKQFG